MKKISYRVVREFNAGTEGNPKIQQYFEDFFAVATDDELPHVLEIIESIAYNGEYTVEDIPDEEVAPTQLDIIEAQATYTAMMTDTLLEV